jgi:hypothetical protein
LKNIFFEKFSDHSEFFFYFSIHKKLNGQKKKFGSLLLAEKKIGSLKKTFFENFVIGFQCWGFQFMLILDLWGKSFHPAVVVGLGNDLLFNSSVGHCVSRLKNIL